MRLIFSISMWSPWRIVGRLVMCFWFGAAPINDNTMAAGGHQSIAEKQVQLDPASPSSVSTTPLTKPAHFDCEAAGGNVPSRACYGPWLASSGSRMESGIYKWLGRWRRRLGLTGLTRLKCNPDAQDTHTRSCEEIWPNGRGRVKLADIRYSGGLPERISSPGRVPVQRTQFQHLSWLWISSCTRSPEPPRSNRCIGAGTRRKRRHGSGQWPEPPATVKRERWTGVAPGRRYATERTDSRRHSNQTRSIWSVTLPRWDLPSLSFTEMVLGCARRRDAHQGARPQCFPEAGRERL